MQPSPEGSSSNASDHFALNFQVLRPSKCHGENSLKAERGRLGTHWLSSQNYLEKCSCTVVCSIRGKELSSLSHLSSILLDSRPCVAWSTSPGCKQYWVADEHRLIALLLREPQLLEEVGAQLSLKCLSLGLFCQQEALLTRTCFWLVTGRLWANMLPWKLENAKLWLDSSIVKKEYQSSSICSYPWPRGCVPLCHSGWDASLSQLYTGHKCMGGMEGQWSLGEQQGNAAEELQIPPIARSLCREVCWVSGLGQTLSGSGEQLLSSLRNQHQWTQGPQAAHPQGHGIHRGETVRYRPSFWSFHLQTPIGKQGMAWLGPWGW